MPRKRLIASYCIRIRNGISFMSSSHYYPRWRRSLLKVYLTWVSNNLVLKEEKKACWLHGMRIRASFWLHVVRNEKSCGTKHYYPVYTSHTGYFVKYERNFLDWIQRAGNDKETHINNHPVRLRLMFFDITSRSVKNLINRSQCIIWNMYVCPANVLSESKIARTCLLSCQYRIQQNYCFYVV